MSKIVTGVTTSEGFINAVNAKGANISNIATPDALRDAINIAGGNITFESTNEEVIEEINEVPVPPQKFYLTINYNGGTNTESGATFEEIKVEKGTTVDLSTFDSTKLTAPENTTYDGITTTKDDDSTKITSITVNNDVTVYVYWITNL